MFKSCEKRFRFSILVPVPSSASGSALSWVSDRFRRLLSVWRDPGSLPGGYRMWSGLWPLGGNTTKVPLVPPLSSFESGVRFWIIARASVVVVEEEERRARMRMSGRSRRFGVVVVGRIVVV